MPNGTAVLEAGNSKHVSLSPATIRVLALMPYPLRRVPGQRYRLEQWAPRLRAEGIEIEFSSFLSPAGLDVLHEPGHSATKALEIFMGYSRRLRELRRLDDFDVAFIYREAALSGKAWLEKLVARRIPFVFDFDDAIYLRAISHANRRLKFLKPPGKAEAICRLASCVTVGSDNLAAFARRYAESVEVVPTTIDTELYSMAPKWPTARPVIGWTGSVTTAEYLSMLRRPLQKLRRILDFEFRVIGTSLSIDGVDVRCMSWRAETEVEDLRPIDVGVMPLTDSEWSRGKCAGKALQYMALGIPPVLSPVGASAIVVEDGKNGFYARSEAEWVDRLALLLRDAELRARLGAAARQTVEERYSARVQVPRLADLFRRVRAGSPKAR